MNWDSWLHSLAGHSAFLDDLIRFGANYLLYLGALAALIAIWTKRDAAKVIGAAIFGSAVGWALARVVLHFWQRPRPFVAQHFVPLVAHATDASFPSDHMIVIGAITIAVWQVHRRASAWIGAIAILLAICRAAAGIHYITDLVAGFLFGGAGALAGWYLLRPFTETLRSVSPSRRRSG